MSQKVIDLSCPSCGAPASTGKKECLYCRRPITISTFNSIYDMSIPDINKYASTYHNALSKNPENTKLNNSIAMCYLKLRLYDKAYSAFEKAIEHNINSAETYFYAAICLLKGKKAFVLSRPIIDKIEEYINAALMIKPIGIYYYFHAYIKYDYYKRKYFNTSPTYQDLLELAIQSELSGHDVSQLFLILGNECPKELSFP